MRISDWSSDVCSSDLIVPLLIVTPLTFLGGSFYSINMLPPFWQTVTLFNPVVYLISGFRWSFYGIADVNVYISLGVTLFFLALRSEEHTSELQSLMRISYAVFCLKKKKQIDKN